MRKWGGVKGGGQEGVRRGSGRGQEGIQEGVGGGQEGDPHLVADLVSQSPTFSFLPNSELYFPFGETALVP